MKSKSFSRMAAGILAVMLFSPIAALAGPPLVCHPIEIGKAKSLPWADLNYRNGDGGYQLKNLVQDTLAILDANTPVLVHMETLRRATIYARQDPQVKKELITRLQARAVSSDSSGHADALAWFDFGYLVESYKQWTGKGEPNPAAGVDGYALVIKAISLRGTDPEMEFAAAMITIGGPDAPRKMHLQKASAGAESDPLLAQNLASRFNRQTISELLVSAAAHSGIN